MMCEEIVNCNALTIFNTDLQKLRNNTEEEDEETLNNTHIIVYRNTPIALISISKNNALSKKNESLTMNINCLGARKVYLPSGVVHDMIDWAMIRTKALCSATGEKVDSLRLIVEVFSFDEKMKQILRRKGFVFVQSGKIMENRLLGGLFGVKKELWGCQFRFNNAKNKKK